MIARLWVVVLIIAVAGACGGGADAVLMDLGGSMDGAVDAVPDIVVPETSGEELLEEVGSETIDDADVCVPVCDGLDCGDDGCGGSCGECSELMLCSDEGVCKCSFTACLESCCSEEEICFEDACCVADCEGRECGSDGCGGSCGDCSELETCSDAGACECAFEGCNETCCPAGEACFEEACCAPVCEDKECGDDTCGGLCAECDPGYKCTDEFTCICAFSGCGENCCGEGQICTEAGCCLPDCDGKTCGDDGCGGSCGECSEFASCTGDFACGCDFLDCDSTCCSADDVCFEQACCKPDCDGKECGTDGCGGSCGTCGEYAICTGGGICACSFAPCGEFCCADGQTCSDGVCCNPVCADDVECGDDGCGGSCGECEAGCVCGAGVCIGSCGECIPVCGGNECGWDGCGGQCGICANNEKCNTETWLCETGQCSLPQTFPGDGYHLNSLFAGKDGTTGEAIDLDNDMTTCAPANACEDGRDNSFGSLMKSIGPFLGSDEPINEAVVNGNIMMVVELVDPKFDGSLFMSNIYRADAVSPKSACNFETETCDYQIVPESFVAQTCLPITAFDNVQISGTTITAGGPAYNLDMPFTMAMTGWQEIIFPATHARMVAEVQVNDQGVIVGLSGILGAAVPKSEIIGMVNDIPENALPISKDLMISVLQMVVKADIDADGDGEFESVSACMKFTAIPGNIVGLAN